MREIWSNLPAQGQQLFPLLRSTSDLLMMPKDLLLEEGIRADMCSSVSTRLCELNVMYLRVCFRAVAVAAGAVVCISCMHVLTYDLLQTASCHDDLSW
jgi:hypothetical protein